MKSLEDYVQTLTARSLPWKMLEDKLEMFKASGHPFVPAVLYLEALSRDYELPLYYVGGFLRDLQTDHNPNDIDVMYNVASKQLIEAVTKEYFVRKNRFGGLKLNFTGTPIDMWAIEETNYFSPWMNMMDPPPTDRLPLLPIITNFPLVTFLTVESVIFEVYRERDPLYYMDGDVVRLGWEEGFFEACLTRTLELQLLATFQGNIMNPVPELDLVRVHKLYSQGGWSIGSHLREYLRRELSKTTAERLAEIHRKHYGYILDAKKICADLGRMINPL